MVVLQLVEGLHYHSPGERRYVSHAGHWISRLAGERIWSIMEQPIDFPLFICSAWHESEENVSPWVH